MHVGLQTCSTAMVSLQLSKLAIFPSVHNVALNIVQSHRLQTYATFKSLLEPVWKAGFIEKQLQGLDAHAIIL